MHLFQYTFLTFIVAFIIQYWIISVLKSSIVKHSTGKLYLSLISASVMGILEVMIYDTYKSTVSLYYYLLLGALIWLSLYMYKSVDDVNYLNELLESHAYETRLSKKVMESTDNSQIITIANNLIHRREKDIVSIQKLLHNPDENKKGKITKSNLFNYMDIGRGQKQKPEHKVGGSI
jgi:hypothetical protein